MSHSRKGTTLKPDIYQFSFAAALPRRSFIKMGSGASRPDLIESRWWEGKAQHVLRTTRNTGKVEVICSFIPFTDDKTLVEHLAARSDLDTLLAIYCRRQNLSEEQSTNTSKETDDSKAMELWCFSRDLFPFSIESLIPPLNRHDPSVIDMGIDSNGDARSSTRLMFIEEKCSICRLCKAFSIRMAAKPR